MPLIKLKQISTESQPVGFVPKIQPDGTLQYASSVATSVGTIALEIGFTTDISGVTAPPAGLIGTDIDTLAFPHGSDTGQKFEFTVPDDYDSGSIDFLVAYGMSTAVATPNNQIKVQTLYTIAKASTTGTVTTSGTTNQNVTTPQTTAVTRAVLYTITNLGNANFNRGDVISFHVLRIGSDLANDKHTGVWEVVGFMARYQGQVANRSIVQSNDLFRNTSNPAPTPGTIGTDIDVLVFPFNVDFTEQKYDIFVPDNWDGVSDVQIRADYAMSTAVLNGVVQLETAGQVANVLTGAVDTLPVVDFNLMPPNDTAVHRTVTIRSIPASALSAGDQITVRLSRRTGVGGNHGGSFQLITTSAIMGQSPSSGFIQSILLETYLQQYSFGNLTGTVTGDVAYPSFAGDFEEYLTTSSLSAAGRIDTAFPGRFGLSQSAINRVKIYIKGTGATPQYRLKIYAEGQGATPVYDSGLQSSPVSITELTVNSGSLSFQPTTPNGRFFIVVESYLNNGDANVFGLPLVQLQ